MHYVARENVINHLAKADALYYAIGMAITILELALIATNKNFGHAGLELSFLVQIIFSVIIESSAGILFLRQGPHLTTVYGMLSKIVAALLLGAAIFSSNSFRLTVTWLFLGAFFIADGIGSGCLLSAFRPAYAQWYAEKMNHKEQADFLKIFKMKLLIRISLPLIILLASVLFFYVTQLSAFLRSNYYFYSSIVIVVTMLITRLYQLKITCSDFKGLDKFKKENSKQNACSSITLKSFKESISKIKGSLFVYILGDIAFLSVMMYAIGLGFKLTANVSMPFYLAWLGGALIGFVIYLISSLFGYFIYPRFNEAFHHGKIALAILILLVPTVFCAVAFYMYTINYQIIALLIFSLTSVTVGNGLLRLMTNHIIRNVEASTQQAIFILGEATASLIIALAVIVSLWFSNTNATIIVLCAFILVLGLASIFMLIYDRFTCNFDRLGTVLLQLIHRCIDY